MKTISGKVVSTKPVSLSDAAAMLSNFAATETGASDAVSVYIRRAADAFNQLVQFHHEIRSSNSNSGTNFIAKEQFGEYVLKRSKNPEIIVKQEESVKVEQFPEEKLLRRKDKKQGNDKIRDLIKTEPDSLATEENRKNKNYGAEKVKKEDKVKIEKSEEVRVGISGKLKTESTLLEGESTKKDKKKKKKKLSEGNEEGGGGGGETLIVETKKRKSEDIDGSIEQNSKKKKSKKQRVESK